MKKLLTSFLFASLLAVPLVAGAQYGGGGGSSYTAPAPTLSPPGGGAGGSSSVVVLINKNKKITKSSKIVLTLPKTNADQMAISNTADFKNASWEKYSETKEWKLKPTRGKKTVYVMFRDSSIGKTTAVVKGNITLKSSAAKAKTSKSTPTAAEKTTSVKSTPSTSSGFQFTKFLSTGSSGEEVKQLQTKLKDSGYYNGPVSGYFGSQTKAAVTALQKAKKIGPAPGYVGPATRAALNSL